jgi:hypothetical protein
MAISGIKYNSPIQALKAGLGAILLVSPNEVDTTTSGEPHHHIYGVGFGIFRRFKDCDRT